MAERIQMSTEVTTGVDHRFVTPAQHSEDGGTHRASGKLMTRNSQFHRCGDIKMLVAFPVPFAFLGEEGACTCTCTLGNRQVKHKTSEIKGSQYATTCSRSC